MDETSVLYTGNDGYSGGHYSGNNGYSGLNPPDDAILFTVSGITAKADKFLWNFDKNDDFFCIFRKKNKWKRLLRNYQIEV